jgi:rhamnulokinase
MSVSRHLAVDLGAESGRAVLGTLDGGRLSISEGHRFPNEPLRLFGHLHWNLYGLFEEVKKAMRLAGSEGLGPESLAVDTWGVDFGLLARDGSVLGLPYCYRDSRTQGAMEAYFKLVPREALYEATGIQFMPFNTLFQVYAMVRDRSPLLDAASDLLFMPDLFAYLLTGRKSSEFTMATTSQFFDPRRKAWASGLFQAMGLSKRILQEVLAPGKVIGPLLPEIAKETGLGDIPVVATASHDTGAAVAAVPATGEDWAYISSGTWSLVGIEAPGPIITREALQGNFTNEGGVGGTTRFLKNVTGLWLLQQCRRAWTGDREYGYEDLVRLAAEAPPFSALIDPDDARFLNPTDMPAAIADYCRETGQAPPATAAAFTRCIFESLALKYRLVLDQLRRAAGRELATIHVIGGGSRNEVLCQFTANATGLPVLAGPAEATAIGNILVQAVGLGRVASFEAMRRIIRESFEIRRYEPRQAPAWSQACERFRNIIGA